MKLDIFFLCAVILFGCDSNHKTQQTNNKLQLRQMTQKEMQRDFNQLVEAVKEYYGPLEYKERRFAFQLDDVVDEYRKELSKAQSEHQMLGIFFKFLATFKDAHVGIRLFNYNKEVQFYSAGILIVPFRDKSSQTKAYLASLDHHLEEHGIALWDELVLIDGKDTMSYLETIKKYQNLGNEESTNHLIYKALERPAFMTDLLPVKNYVNLVFKKPDDSLISIDRIWNIKQSVHTPFVDDIPFNLSAQSLMDINSIAEGTMAQMGSVDPFFLTEDVKKEFDIERVSASKEKLAKYGFQPEDKIPEIYAGLYVYSGKRVLLVRNSSYHHSIEMDGFSNEDYMKHYRALLDQWDSVSDILVIDQTHNGGGSYCQDFFRLFIQKQENGFVQKNNADRAWIRSFIDQKMFTQDSKENLFFARAIENAIDKGDSLSEPLPLLGSNKVGPDQFYHWQKPVLILVDELSASCADAFPMLMKRNHIAKLFGQTTVGAGGNVELIEQLRVSGAEVALTRGLFSSFGMTDEKDFIENNGVKPDYIYEHSIEDVRKNFVGYVHAFSEKAVAILN